VSAPTTPHGYDAMQPSLAPCPGGAAGAPAFYQALADYTAVHDGELDLVAGDVVTDVRDLGNGWTLGRRVDDARPSTSSRSAAVGIFPSNCVQPMIADAAGSCPYMAGAAAERCPGCRVQDGRTACHGRWTTALKCDCDCDAHDDQRSAARFNFVEGVSDDDDDDVDVYRMGVRSYGTAVMHSSLPRGHCYPPHQQRQPADSDGLRLGDAGSGAESEDVRCGLVSATSPVLVCRGRELTAAEVNKPRMIVKPNLDRGGSARRLSTPAVERVGPRDVCYCSPLGYGTSSRSAVPPRELPLASHHHVDLDDADVTATTSCATARRRASTETKPRGGGGGGGAARRLVDVPLPPAPTPLDRRALSADSNCKLSLSGGDDGPASDSRCSEASGLYRDGTGSSYPFRSVYESGYFGRSAAESRSCRLVMSVVVGHLVGVAVFLWMFFHLGYGPLTAVAVSSTVAVLTCVLLALSRLCRCTAALVAPSLCVANGRVAFVVVATGFELIQFVLPWPMLLFVFM